MIKTFYRMKHISIFVITLIFVLFSVYFIYRLRSNKINIDGRDLSTLVITLERTSCFGNCPDYSVTLLGDGRVFYEGRNFVRVKGIRQGSVDTGQLQALVDDFEKAGFFGFNDEYTAQVSDLPTKTTSISIGGEYKKVINYYGAPQILTQLEDKIDEVAGTRKWVEGEVEVNNVVNLTPVVSPTAAVIIP